MPYVTGSANDMDALKAALISACTGNGWANAGDVLHKGNVYIELLVSGAYLTLKGGEGIDGGDALTGAEGGTVQIGRPSTGVADLSWPVVYEIFVGTAPDEVCMVINYNVDLFQFIAFGQSTISDLPGTGAWYSASLANYFSGSSLFISINPYGGGYPGITMGFFWRNYANPSCANSMINHGLDGVSWNPPASILNCAHAIQPLTAVLPNAWNSAAALLPVQVWLPRADNKVSMVVDMVHIRYVRVDNHAPGEVITIGSDRWKVFPFYRKNVAVRDAGSSVDHTGTFGFAVRYDGP